MKALFLSLALAVGLNACGYHLQGQGDQTGIIPQGTKQIIILPSQGAEKLGRLFRQKLAQSSDIAILRMQDAHPDMDAESVEIRLENAVETKTASAY
ncbi:MAG: hypothetical protein Q9M20_03035, partial [Mariprofundaceae bacterium]|nr:hypothetical protein [Mariprofundaceae bacterium]